MTLYELMKLRDEDYIETTDDVFDCIVGSNFIENEVLTDFDDFYYNNFCYYISNCIEVLDANNYYPICDWSGFINKHFNELYDFAKNNWKGIPLEKDDFIYEWISELHLYQAGYVSENIYKKFLDVVGYSYPFQKPIDNNKVNDDIELNK